MFLSQLRLYNPLSKTDHDIWEGDDEKCKEAYEINEESIRYVRRNGRVDGENIPAARRQSKLLLHPEVSFHWDSSQHHRWINYPLHSETSIF